jgi:hypothetical protein
VFSDSSQADSGTVAIVTHDPQQKVTNMSLGTNDTESPNHSPETPSRRRAGMPTGALLGAMALTAAVVGISAVAGAQDSSTDRRKATVEMAKTTSTELDDTTVMLEDDEAWAAFDQCLSDALGPIDEDGIKDTELTDDEWEALEVQFETAEASCEEFLPDDVKSEIAAFQPFDDCIDAQLGDKTIKDEPNSLTTSGKPSKSSGSPPGTPASTCCPRKLRLRPSRPMTTVWLTPDSATTWVPPFMWRTVRSANRFSSARTAAPSPSQAMPRGSV